MRHFLKYYSLSLSDGTEDFERSAILHQKMEELGGYSADRRAERNLLGLGLPLDKLGKAVSSFFGGWRIRLNLARALIAPYDLLFPDELTKQLDLDATLWL